MGSDDPYTPPTTPTPGTGMTAIDKTFVITVAPTQAYGATGNRYYVDGQENPVIMEVGKRYAFDLSSSTTSKICKCNGKCHMTYGELTGTIKAHQALFMLLMLPMPMLELQYIIGVTQLGNGQ